MRVLLLSILTVPTAAFAEAFPNPGFEDGLMDGWSVGGRKDAAGEVIETKPIFDALSNSRRFRSQGGWEQHPVVPFLDAERNRHALRISSNGYITAETQSTILIEAGNRYEVSAIGVSQNGGPNLYHLDISYLDDNGDCQPLAASRIEVDEEELFRQTATFTAEGGQPHVGKRIVLSARYRGTNILDQAMILVSPIEQGGLDAVVQQLPIADTLDDEDGTPRFTVRGFEDFRYQEPVEDPGQIRNTGAGFEALAQWTPENHHRYTLYDLDELTLEDGAAAGVVVTLAEPDAHAGFALDGNLFLLGRDASGMHPFRTPDFMSWIAQDSGDLTDETIVLVRTGNRIEWFACERKGHFDLTELSDSPRLSLFASGMVTLSQFRQGNLRDESYDELESFLAAPPSPFGRRKYPGLPDHREPDPAKLIEQLSTDLDAPLSDGEIEAMVEYASSFPPHGFGPNANPLFSLPKWFEPARIFQITRRREVLDDLIRIADAAIVTRNGFNGQGIRIGGEFNRIVNLHGADPDRIVSQTSDPENSRTIVPAMAAFWVSQHPEIWDEQTTDDFCQLGSTYRERAERYLKELALNYEDYRTIRLSRFRTEPIWDSYREYYDAEERFAKSLEDWEAGRHHAASTAAEGKKDEVVATYDASTPKPEHPYQRAAVNRFVSAVSCAGFAAHAAETFGDKESMRSIDACAEKLLTSWFNTYHFLAPGHDGEHLDDPSKWYRVFGYTAPNVHFGAIDYDLNTPRGEGIRSEDRAHMNFTLNGLQLLYESHRYEHIMTPKVMTELARTIDEMVLPEYNLWRPLPRARKHRDVSPQRGFSYQASSMLMFGDFNPSLQEKLTRCLIESGEGHPRVMNFLNLALMRAEKHEQIRTEID